MPKIITTTNYYISTFFFDLFFRPVRPIAASAVSIHVSLCSATFSPFKTPEIPRSSYRCLYLPLGRLLFPFRDGQYKSVFCSPDASGPSYSLALECHSYMLGSLNKVFSSLFDLISKPPWSFPFGPNILRRIFLSKYYTGIKYTS